jgi:hypothetical protein
MRSTEGYFIALLFIMAIAFIPCFILGANNKNKTSVIIQNVFLAIITIVSIINDYGIVQFGIIVWWIILFFHSSSGRAKSLWIRED